jgi:RNA polymerase sporulation-specific sigma factor
MHTPRGSGGTEGPMGSETLSAEAADEELVGWAQDGDDRAIGVLLERYRHYARAKARSYFLAGADREDIVQEGMIGLYKAIRDYRPDKASAFRAFAELCIKRQIITAIKSATRRKHQPLNSYVSLNRPASSESDEDRPLGDLLVGPKHLDPAELVISEEEIAALKSSIWRVLSELEIEVLRLYMNGQSYQQIAETLGRHVKSIDNALQRIKRKLESDLAARAG